MVKPPKKALSERHPESVKNEPFSSKVTTFPHFFGMAEARSFVENDGLPSFHGAPDPCKSTRVMMVGLPLRGVRVFKHFAWLGVDSGKMALSRPAHQRVTRAVRRFLQTNVR